MNTLKKYTLSFIVISLLSFSLLTKTSTALDIPGVPSVPNKPHPPTVPAVPDKPEAPGVPTTPPLPTSGGQNPTSTPPAQVNPTTPPPVGGLQPTQPPEEDEGENGNGVGGQVLGISAASGDLTEEIGLMVIGLVIASFGVKNLVAKKLS